MKEREDLLKTKGLCEKILEKDPLNALILQKLEAVKAKLRLIERRVTEASIDEASSQKVVKNKKDSFKTGYL